MLYSFANDRINALIGHFQINEENKYFLGLLINCYIYNL